MDKISILSPAKVNIFLEVLKKRNDSFHDIVSLITLLNFGDTLSFEKIKNGIEIEGVANIKLEENLIYKAYSLVKIQKNKDISSGIKISVKKQIPIGGGLGGGSSNAASTLIMLNKIWQLKIPMRKLMDMAVQLGSDVPVFMHGKHAFIFGRGEQVMFTKIKESFFVLVTFNNIHCSTRELFQNPELKKRKQMSLKVSNIVNALKSDYLLNLSDISRLTNDFEHLAYTKYSLIKDTINIMNYTLNEKLNNSLIVSPRLSGTGSSVFCVFNDLGNTKSFYEKIKTNLPDGATAHLTELFNGTS